MTAPGARLPDAAVDILADDPLVEAEVVVTHGPKRGRVAALAYLGLRTANSGATVAAGFLTTFLLVRRLGVDGYSSFVITTAVGIYLSATDAGISRTVYARLREAFLRGEVAEERVRVAGAVLLYAAVTLAALTVFTGVQFATAHPDQATTQSLYFVFVALNLPWMLLRYIGWAVDEHLRFDAIDLVRRLAQIGVFFLALTSLDLRLVFALLDLVWLAGFLGGAAVVARRLGSLLPGAAGVRRALAGFWGSYAAMLRFSVVFSLIEFAIYNFPYVLIPLAYGKGAPLVAFDLFYKLFRAGVTGNQIASTTVLPRQTRAFHVGDATGVMRWTRGAIALSVAAVSPLAIGLLLFGPQVLNLLLSGASVIGWTGIAAVVIATYANSFQNAAGSLLVHIGLIRQGVAISYAVLAIMAALALAAALGLFDVERFILAYATAYALGSAAWAVLAARAIERHFAATPRGETA